MDIHALGWGILMPQAKLEGTKPKPLESWLTPVFSIDLSQEYFKVTKEIL